MTRWNPPDERRRHEAELLTNIRASLANLDALLAEINSKWVYEDLTYRFYHQSFKVYALQSVTTKMVGTFQSLLPQLPLNEWFLKIVAEGTGKEFVMEHNERWAEIARPILEAFFHARYFLEMACKYGRQFEEPPNLMPGGYAAILYLFNIR